MSETHAIPTCFCRISYAATATFARRKTARHLRASRRRARRQRHFGCIEIVDVDVRKTTDLSSAMPSTLRIVPSVIVSDSSTPSTRFKSSRSHALNWQFENSTASRSSASRMALFCHTQPSNEASAKMALRNSHSWNVQPLK